MNFKGTSYTILIFWIIFLGNASSSYATDPAPQSFVCDGREFIVQNSETFSLRENYSLAYKINFNKTITHASCSNEVTNASLKFIYTDGTNYFGGQSTLIVSREAAGKWNCKVWMTGNCILEYYFQVKVIHFHITASIEDTTCNSIIQPTWSEAIVTAKGENFWIQFKSDFPIVSASCLDVNGNGQLELKYIASSSKKSIKSYIQATDKAKGPWNCSFDDDLGVRKFVLLKVIWRPSTLSTPTTTQLSTTLSTTSERKPSTLSTPTTTQLTTTLSTTTETTGLSSSTHRGEGAPTALTKSTTEPAQNKDDKENTANPLCLMVGAVVTSLVILAILVIVCIVVYRRKAQTPTTAPQPEAPVRIEQSVYYTIHGDDYNEEYSYAYAYARPEPLRTNVACNNALYDTVSDK